MIFFFSMGPETAPSSSSRASQNVDIAELFDEHGAFLLRVLVRLVMDEAIAEDMAQEVFLIAHRKRAELDGEKNVAAWLYRVAVNVAWRHRRTFARRARLRDAAEQEAASGATIGAPGRHGDPERSLDDAERARRVRECLARLPREQREVFTLYELEEKSGEEIAALQGIPVATVWTRLHRARERFRRAWTIAERGAA